MIPDFLWQGPESQAVKLKFFSYSWGLLIIQSWAKFTQINFILKLQLYILCFIL